MTSQKKLSLKNGTSTIEYLILFAAIVGILLAFLRPNGPLWHSVTTTLDSGTKSIGDMDVKVQAADPLF